MLGVDAQIGLAANYANNNIKLFSEAVWQLTKPIYV